MSQEFVPVIHFDGYPLMPTIPSRARRWIKTGKATPFWSHGLFCVRLNVAPSDTKTQPIATGIDPGSKKEGYTVKSTAHTYLNIQADAVTHVKKAVKTRHTLRRHRRYRKTPCRPSRKNRARGSLPPSTKARWQWKLRIARWLTRTFPSRSLWSKTSRRKPVPDSAGGTAAFPRWQSASSGFMPPWKNSPR